MTTSTSYLEVLQTLKDAGFDWAQTNGNDICIEDAISTIDSALCKGEIAEVYFDDNKVIRTSDGIVVLTAFYSFEIPDVTEAVYTVTLKYRGNQPFWAVYSDQGQVKTFNSFEDARIWLFQQGQTWAQV